MDLVRIVTAGSVDDGKSTLIGRLLLECRALTDDTVRAVEEVSAARGYDHVDLALVTDGLRSEREQGITIDVAHRAFTNGRRQFFLADTPGHVEYTRNMVTGASQADVGLVLVDVRNGMNDQSKRHLAVLRLLGVAQVVVVVNKLDLVDYAQDAFERVRAEIIAYADRLGSGRLDVVPVSALHGDNVTDQSARMPWYAGPSVLALLDSSVGPEGGGPDGSMRLPVQLVVRPGRAEFRDFRGYAGRLTAGAVRVGQRVMVLPRRRTSVVTGISVAGRPVTSAAAPLSVLIELGDDLDISRGDLICAEDTPPRVGQDLTATVVWLSNEARLSVGSMWTILHTTQSMRARIVGIDGRLDVSDLVSEPAVELAGNDIGRVRLRTTQPLAWDPYVTDRTTGSFVVVDPRSHGTVGAGILDVPDPSFTPPSSPATTSEPERPGLDP